jgi:cyclophilin family peptidyl-prolyl cis-trans isomerase
MKSLMYIVLCIAVLVGIFFMFSKDNSKEEVMSQNATHTAASANTEPPKMSIDTSKTYTATFDTDKGVITVNLHAKETPNTVNNFVHLARAGFYNNTIFHRTMAGFMIQGGDPKGDGTGGPGYSFPDEKFSGKYERGVLAMANRGPNTNGSQFFIMHKDYDLAPDYVIFGKVSSGLDVVDAIATAPVTAHMGENSKPVTPVVIKTITIEEK